MSYQLFTNGYGTAEAAFGRIGDPVSNGRPAGGVHVDSAAPTTAREHELAIDLGGPKAALNPRSSGLFWLGAMAVGFGWLNYRARR
jgi:hypothetical protein